MVRPVLYSLSLILGMYLGLFKSEPEVMCSMQGRDSSNEKAEATWGADPLECSGGFRALEPDTKAEYKSSLAPNGLVSWTSRPFDTLSMSPTMVEGILTVDFPGVDWRFLQSAYGWAALQYQAWARGYLNIATDSTQSILLFTDHVLEFFVDDTHYFGGDFYAYRRAPLVLHLKPGIHKFDIRLVRDVRAMGGIGEPKVNVKLEVEIANRGLAIVEQKLLISDVVDETLASPFASVPVRNEGLGWLSITKIESLTVCSGAFCSCGYPLILLRRHLVLP